MPKQTCLFRILLTTLLVLYVWKHFSSPLSNFSHILSSQATENWEISEKSSTESSSSDTIDAMLFTSIQFTYLIRPRRDGNKLKKFPSNSVDLMNEHPHFEWFFIECQHLNVVKSLRSIKNRKDNLLKIIHRL